MRTHLLALLCALAPSVLADGVKFTSPAAGGSVAAGTFNVRWGDGGGSPDMAQLSTYTLQLVFGGNQIGTDAVQLITCGQTGGAVSSGTATCSIAAAVANQVTNGYYLMMTSTAAEGGTIINYSSRFTITGMTGNQPAAYVTGARSVAGANDVPEEVNNVGNVQNGVAATGAAGGGETPYNLQSGLTKYAPMQPVPPTKISQKGYSRLFPTSAFNVATTFLPLPSIVTTITASQTFKVTSIENTIAAQASMPTGDSDMAKFLARWKD